MKKRWISLLLVFAMMVVMAPHMATEAKATTLTYPLTEEDCLLIYKGFMGHDLDLNDPDLDTGFRGSGDYEQFYAEWYEGEDDIPYYYFYVYINTGECSVGVPFGAPRNFRAEDYYPLFVESGTCGDNLTWTLDDKGTLTISGTGNMDNYYQTEIPSPWHDCSYEIKSIVIENGVTSIGNSAFYLCTEVTNVSIPNSVVMIDDFAFLGCWSLTSITIPDSVDTIGECAFHQCSSITDVTISNGVDAIGPWSFAHCTSLSNVTIPQSVTSIGEGSFYGCKNLSGIQVDSNNQFYSSDASGVLYSKDHTTLVRVPGAFSGKYSVSNQVTSIGNWALGFCTELTDVVIPSSVISIGIGAFDYCENLNNVYYGGTAAQWSEIEISVYNDYLTNATIHFESEIPTAPVYPDTWSFINSYDYFGDASDGYYITTADHNRLIGKLTNTERELFYRYRYMHLYNIDGNLRPSNYLYEPYRYWGGSCYGMSSWVVLNSHHIRSASEIDSTTKYLAEFILNPFENSNIESAINFYQFQHYLSPIQEDSNGFMALSQKAQIDILAELGKHANQTGELFLICFQGYLDYLQDGSPNLESSVAHAVVGYGWEEIDPILLTVNGKTAVYDHRIWIYDCSRTRATQDMNLYYNGGNWTWCIPGWNLISTDSQSTNSLHNNAVLELATNDVSLINTVDYSTGQANTGESVVSVTTDANARYSLGFNAVQADISGFSVNSDILDHGITVMLHPNITPDGTATETLATAVIPDAQEYVVTSADDMMAYTMQNEHYLTYSALDAPGSITFMNNGNTVIQSGIVADYTINLVANDGYHTLDWCEIEISGTASVVSTETSEEGIIVTSDNLTNLTVYAENDGHTLTITASSEEHSVLITENSDGNLAVCEDIDADGIYETEIAASCPFTDVPTDSFYYIPVLWALENNITTGATATTFNPTGSCLRAQVVTFLWRAAGCPAPTSTHNPFVDVKPTDFYYDAVLWAVEKGITNGADATHFNPMGVCNRAQVVTFLYRAFESPAVEDGNTPFTDVPAGQWYAAPVAWAVENEITNGLSATTFGPTASCNRAQIVTFLYRAYN